MTLSTQLGDELTVLGLIAIGILIVVARTGSALFVLDLPGIELTD